ncbi:MAG: hypothetical protein M1831_000589 [Alyxoria varia]|nr:MAG: hypothetical protein M1831_000589 [Alyxoria varia]
MSNNNPDPVFPTSDTSVEDPAVEPSSTQQSSPSRSSQPQESSQPRSSSEPNGSNESASQQPLLLYQPPTLPTFLRSVAINLILPFINGLMVGFGELLAHEAAFRLGWSQTRVFPDHRRDSRRDGKRGRWGGGVGGRTSRTHVVGPGVEMREGYGKDDNLEDYTGLE